MSSVLELSQNGQNHKIIYIVSDKDLEQNKISASTETHDKFLGGNWKHLDLNF